MLRNMWVIWVNIKPIEDMLELDHVVTFHENRMKNGGEDMLARLNTRNGVKNNENH